MAAHEKTLSRSLSHRRITLRPAPGGFTLIEMLVVTEITAIPAALFLSALSRTRNYSTLRG